MFIRLLSLIFFYGIWATLCFASPDDCRRALVPAVAKFEGFTYQATKLNHRFSKEAQRVYSYKEDRYIEPTVRYITTDEERSQYKLFFKDGLIYKADGTLFDTTASSIGNADLPVAKFVMTVNGDFYATTYHEIGVFHHSSLVAGAPVAAAGEIQVMQGRLVYLNDASGHYYPRRLFTYQALNELVSNGIDLANVVIKFISDPHKVVKQPVPRESWVDGVESVLLFVQNFNQVDLEVEAAIYLLKSLNVDLAYLAIDIESALKSNLNLNQMTARKPSERRVRVFLISLLLEIRILLLNS